MCINIEIFKIKNECVYIFFKEDILSIVNNVSI